MGKSFLLLRCNHCILPSDYYILSHYEKENNLCWMLKFHSWALWNSWHCFTFVCPKNEKTVMQNNVVVGTYIWHHLCNWQEWMMSLLKIYSSGQKNLLFIYHNYLRYSCEEDKINVWFSLDAKMIQGDLREY